MVCTIGGIKFSMSINVKHYNERLFLFIQYNDNIHLDYVSLKSNCRVENKRKFNIFKNVCKD